MRLRRVVAVAALVLLAGCASMDRTQRSDGLRLATLHYAKALRWGDLPAALAMTRYPEGEKAPNDRVDLNDLTDLKVTHYDVGGLQPDPDLKKARAILELEYYFERNGRVHRLIQQQNWWYDDTTRRWYCACPFPKFKP